MSHSLNRQRNTDLNASDRLELDGKINYMFYRNEMETWLEVFQWKDFSCKTLTTVNCLEDTFDLQLKKKQLKKKKREYNFNNIEHFYILISSFFFLVL